MGANKLATMLRRNTNKMTLVLNYAALEWILIVLLLVNSLFSYLIMKFSDYFGLQRPCLRCSRLDRIMKSGKNKSSYRDFVCEVHGSEISKLCYCKNHHRLAESEDMCEDCLSSSQSDSTKLAKNFDFYRWMKQISVVQEDADKAVEIGVEHLACCCCELEFEKRLYPPCNIFKLSFDSLDFSQKQNLIANAGVTAGKSEGRHWDQSRSDFLIDHHDDAQNNEEHREGHIVTDLDGGSCKKTEEIEGYCACSVCDGLKEMEAVEFGKVDIVTEKEKEVMKERDLKVYMDDKACEQNMAHVSVSIQDTSQEALTQHLDFYTDEDDCQLIPVEWIDSAITKDKNKHRFNAEEQGHDGKEDFVLVFGVHVELEHWHNSDVIIERIDSSDKKFSPQEETISSENP